MGATRRIGSIVWVTPPGVVTEASIEATLAELRGHLASGRPYALVFDMTRAGVPATIHRRRLAQHMEANAPAIRRTVRGLAVIVPSALMRGAVTALLWFAPPNVPHRLFAEAGPAREWAESMAGARTVSSAPE